MFLRKKSASDVAATNESASPEPFITDGRKGQPTRKRSVAEAANKRPLVPTDRRAAARDARGQNKEQRARAYEGMQRGEEKYLPIRDKGPQRRYVRDYVDARMRIGQFLLPMAFLFILLNFVLTTINTTASYISFIALYACVFIAIGDTMVMWFGLKKKLTAKFGEVERGTAMYATMRTFQIRRTRMPRPSVKEYGTWPS